MTITLVESTLEELAAAANAEWTAARESLGSAVEHAIACGQALDAVAERLERGQWLAWLAQNFVGSESNAQWCRRFSANADAIRERGTTTIKDTRRFLVEDGIGARWGWTRLSPQDERGIRALGAAGLTAKVIAERYGVSDTTIYNVLKGNGRELRRQQARKRKKAMAALRRQDLDQAAKQAGGDLARWYETLRKLTQEMDRNTYVDPAVRGQISDAYHLARRVEDKISAAIRSLGASS